MFPTAHLWIDKYLRVHYKKKLLSFEWQSWELFRSSVYSCGELGPYTWWKTWFRGNVITDIIRQLVDTIRVCDIRCWAAVGQMIDNFQIPAYIKRIRDINFGANDMPFLHHPIPPQSFVLWLHLWRCGFRPLKSHANDMIIFVLTPPWTETNYGPFKGRLLFLRSR